MSLEAPLILLLAVGFLLALADALRGRLRLAALRAENEWQQRRLEERELALSEAQRRVATSERLAEERGQALARLEPVADRERELREAQARLLSELEGARQREAELAVRLEEERRRGAEKLALLEEASRRLGESFENLAQRIFEEKIARFSQQGGERLEQLIRPLREDLGGFRALVESGFRLEAEQRGFLRGELEQLRRLNERLSAEAESLAKALRGEFRTQGSMGRDDPRAGAGERGTREGAGVPGAGILERGGWKKAAARRDRDAARESPGADRRQGTARSLPQGMRGE